MRRFIVDTDTASDDAAALMIAALSEEIDLLGVTIVAGNVGLKQATDNALMTLEVCGSDAPVYLGAKRPLFRERHETISVHGKDGMGDCDIIHPKRSPEEKRAVEFILEQVERYPNEVELVVLGPATNIALAILTDREIMSKVKHIWSMDPNRHSFWSRPLPSFCSSIWIPEGYIWWIFPMPLPWQLQYGRNLFRIRWHATVIAVPSRGMPMAR